MNNLRTVLAIAFIIFSSNSFSQKSTDFNNKFKVKFTLKDTLGQVTTYLGNAKVRVKMTAPKDLTEMTGGIIVFGEKGVDMFVKTGPMKKGQSKVFVLDISKVKPNGNEPLVIRKIQPTIYTGPNGEGDPAVIWLQKDSTKDYVYKGDGYYEITVVADKDLVNYTYEIQSLFPRDTTFEFNTGPMKKGEKKTFTFQLFKYHTPKKAN